MQQQEQVTAPPFGHDLVKNAPRSRVPRAFFLLLAALFGSLTTLGVEAVARYTPLDASTISDVTMDGMPITPATSFRPPIAPFGGPPAVWVRELPGHRYDSIIDLINDGSFGVTVQGFGRLPETYKVWLSDGCCEPASSHPFRPFALNAGQARTLTLEITIPPCGSGTKVIQPLWPLENAGGGGLGPTIEVHFTMLGIPRVQHVRLGTNLLVAQPPITPLCSS